MNLIKRVGLLAFLVLFSADLQAQEEIPLWPGDDMPYFKSSELVEHTEPCWDQVCVDDVTHPTLTLYQAKANNSGKAVLILPGGGYEFIGLKNEGHDVAEAFAARGISAGVLKYRLPNPKSSTIPHLTPLSDVRRALELMRSLAKEYDFKPEQVGVLGFSAGGHLAAVSSVKPSQINKQNPDFSILIYGVTRIDRQNLNWIKKNLYFRNLTLQEIEENTLYRQVTPQTPPAFLVHAKDDEISHYAESLYYANALEQNGVEREIHLLPSGGHAFALGRESDGTSQWVDLAVDWINRLGAGGQSLRTGL